MSHYLPGEARATAQQPPMQDVVVQLFSHRTIVEPIQVPAVLEPLLVLVLAGAARVEERAPGGQWSAATVSAGDFFLTDTHEPYEMRWQTLEGEQFEVMHLYLGLPLIDQAARELLGPQMREASEWLYWICALNPFTHAAELVRHALYLRLAPTALMVCLGLTLLFSLLAVISFNPQHAALRRSA